MPSAAERNPGLMPTNRNVQLGGGQMIRRAIRLGMVQLNVAEPDGHEREGGPKHACTRLNLER